MKTKVTNNDKGNGKLNTDEKSSKKALWMSTGLAVIGLLLAYEKKNKGKE